MAKIEIPIRVYMGEIEEIINELKYLQTYKLFEGDNEVLINCNDVIKIFANHLRTEILSGSTIESEQKTGEMKDSQSHIERRGRNEYENM